MQQDEVEGFKWGILASVEKDGEGGAFCFRKESGRENNGVEAVSSTWQVQIKVSEAIPSALAGLNGFSSVGHHIIKHCNSGREIQAVSDVHWLLLSCSSAHTWQEVQDSDINLSMERQSWRNRGFYWKKKKKTHRLNFSGLLHPHPPTQMCDVFISDTPAHEERASIPSWQHDMNRAVLLSLTRFPAASAALSVSFFHFCLGLSILWSVSLFHYLMLSIWGNITAGQRLC